VPDGTDNDGQREARTAPASASATPTLPGGRIGRKTLTL